MSDVRLHDADDAARFRDGVCAVWDAAFGTIEDVPEWIDTVWERHRARGDFRLATAHEDRNLVGFAWGYTGERGQFWPDLVAESLGQSVAGWVGGHFEFVELAVVPAARRRGTGGRLHDVLIEGLPHRRALLGTSADPGDPAVRLYTGRGWRTLGALGTASQVMGLDLAAPRSGHV